MDTPILKAYAGDIFFEFLVHSIPSDTIIILPGFPSSNKYDSEISFLYEHGYNVFFPRYLGTYQSRGRFLEENIVHSLKEFISFLYRGRAISLWDLSQKKFTIKKLIIFGGSFSGAISCGLAAIVPSIAKLVLFAPVWDFEKHSNNKEQNLEHITKFTHRAYANLYRFNFNNIATSMSKHKEVSPKFYIPHINKKPTLVLHDPSDKSVSIQHSIAIQSKFSNYSLIRHNLGHGWNVYLLENNWQSIESFLRVKDQDNL